ncbi:MAG: alpha/beta hydrolase [Planctomycetaceae bacterium]
MSKHRTTSRTFLFDLRRRESRHVTFWLTSVFVLLLLPPGSAPVCAQPSTKQPSTEKPTEAGRSRGEFRFQKGIVYARPGQVELKLDAYIPRSAGLHPVVLVVHGGAWTSGSRRQLAFYAMKLARAGFCCFAIDYRLAPKYKFPAQIEDCRAAVRWIRQHAAEYAGDASRLGAIGYSAGGHLAALLGTTGTAGDSKGKVDTRLQCVVAGGAPCEFRHMSDKGRGLSFWLGGTIDEVEQNYRDATPVVFASKDDPPMMFFNGTKDRIVPLKWTMPLFDALRSKGVSVTMHQVDGAGHMAAAANAAALDAAVKFLNQHLQPAELTKTPRQQP